jgi:catalase
MDPSKQTTPPDVMRTAYGCPIAHMKNSLTAGPFGPVLLQDTNLLEKLSIFGKEKTPPRAVHAPGQGAYGTFTLTNDFSAYSKAKIFSTVGKKVNLFCRMSGTFLETGEPDTTRDVRGFAMKMYTEEGNWDLMTINTPVFLNRDMKSGPDGVHAMKKDPRTGLSNPTMTWDFIATHPESLHFITMIHTDRCGTPMSFRNMHGYACNTFSLYNEKNERFWVKFHLVCQQEVKGFTQSEAKVMMSENPHWLKDDLTRAIANGNYPKWKLCAQVMPEDQGYTYPFAFDATKVWPHAEFPLMEIGIVELNRNPTDYHAEVEQVTFSPARVIPGIGFSPDKLLQGRLLIYDDTQKYRVGVHHNQLHVNKAHGVEPCPPNTAYVGGQMNTDNRTHFPAYWPSTFGGPQPDPRYLEPAFKYSGTPGYYDLPHEAQIDLDLYSQPRKFFNLLSEQDKLNTITNYASGLEKCTDSNVLEMMFKHLSGIDQRLGDGVKALVVRKKGGMDKTPAEQMVDRFATAIGLQSQ